MIKQTIKYILIALFSLVCGGIFAQNTDIPDTNPFFYGNEYKGSKTDQQQEFTDLAVTLKTDTVTTTDTSLIYKIREYFRLTGTDTYDQDKPALAYVRMLLNMALGFVSFISLILIIFAFYLIFFDKGEEGLKKAKKILIGVAIALVIMGLSRIIVSTLFGIYQTETIKNI